MLFCTGVWEQRIFEFHVLLANYRVRELKKNDIRSTMHTQHQLLVDIFPFLKTGWMKYL